MVVQNPIYLNQKSLPEPDVAVYSKEDIQTRDYHPTADLAHLAIEVADTTGRHSDYRKDRDKKLPLYAEAGVKEVWIVNIEKRQIEVYKQPLSSQYKATEDYQEDQVIQTSFGVPLQVSNLFFTAVKKRVPKDSLSCFIEYNP